MKVSNWAQMINELPLEELFGETEFRYSYAEQFLYQTILTL